MVPPSRSNPHKALSDVLTLCASLPATAENINHHEAIGHPVVKPNLSVSTLPRLAVRKIAANYFYIKHGKNFEEFL